jgi:hypothetical protein
MMGQRHQGDAKAKRQCIRLNKKEVAVHLPTLTKYSRVALPHQFRRLP